jgi:hypothetical protein
VRLHVHIWKFGLRALEHIGNRKVESMSPTLEQPIVTYISFSDDSQEEIYMSRF